MVRKTKLEADAPVQTTEAHDLLLRKLDTLRATMRPEAVIVEALLLVIVELREMRAALSKRG